MNNQSDTIGAMCFYKQEAGQQELRKKIRCIKVLGDIEGDLKQM
jgi:hypothetical protein